MKQSPKAQKSLMAESVQTGVNLSSSFFALDYYKKTLDVGDKHSDWS